VVGEESATLGLEVIYDDDYRIILIVCISHVLKLKQSEKSKAVRNVAF
jgi:hypothetical protein